MAKIAYQGHTFRKQASLIIDKANSIIEEYQAQGFTLTLRQLYYQFVARDLIANTQKEYDKLGVIINKARLAGLIDWESIIDRTRTVERNPHFENPGDILSRAAEQYQLDTRADQDIYVEVWIEKNALLGVIEPVCRKLDVTYLACIGYYGQSAMWQAAQRIGLAQEDGKKAVVIHLGDHDPSGLDMTRDIRARLRMFAMGELGGMFNDLMGENGDLIVERIALNMEQIKRYKPPSNFAKLSDTRSRDYIAEYGRESWELDALEPKVISDLVEDAVNKYTDQKKRQVRLDEQEKHKKRLAYIAEHWTEID